MLKWIGAVLTVLGCTAAGFAAAEAYRREERYLQQFLQAVRTMRWELNSRRTCLSEAFYMAAEECRGPLGGLLRDVAGQLAQGQAEDVRSCMSSALGRYELPGSVRQLLQMLGFCMGSFDLESQTEQMQIIAQRCGDQLEEFGKERDGKLRLYRVLGICSGLALAIMLV